MTALQRDGADCLVRLYNSSPELKSFSLVVDGELEQVSAVELDGWLIGELKVTAGKPEHRSIIALTLQPFGPATVRLHDLSGHNECNR
ncbi:hypothetical protein [Paenibacillus sp. GCM10027626]|uniref:hypothetical protein n=1 Tax=Paenibacillus sp. GCM10027626 TaxID=3273411 RepID=UPI0036392DE2